MRTTSSIQFYCRKSKCDKSGYAPLECSLTLSGQRKFLNLPVKFRPFNKNKPPKEVLECMDLWRIRINDYLNQMLKFNMVITAETLRTVVQQGGVRTMTCGKLFEDYLLLLRRRVEAKDLQPSVYRKYELAAEKALIFASKSADISTITPALVKRIETYLKAQYDPATVVGYLTRLKTMLTYGWNNGYFAINPVQFLKIVKPVKPIRCLTEDEVMDLLARNFTGTLRRVADLFLIQCGTGLSYADLMRFSVEDLKQEAGYYYISKTRKKTGKLFTAIVLPFAVPIILHYGVMPKISNQKYNKRLKEIDSRLSSHYGRRTYASVLVARGVDMSVASAALGDNLATAAKYYIKQYDTQLIKQQIKALQNPI